MWKTPLGERVLLGAERELFKHALGSLLDEIKQSAEIKEEHSVGIFPFDDLSRPQKLQMMESVAVAFLDRKMPAPRANVLSDATVGAIYAQLRHNIDYELDVDRDPIVVERREGKTAKKGKKPEWPPEGYENDDFRYWWRRVLIDGLRRMEWAGRLPDETNTETNQWYQLVWGLEDRILGRRAWDNDRVLARMRALKTLGAGPVPAYFQAAPPDPAAVSTEAVEYVMERIVKSLGTELEQAIRRRPKKAT